MSLKVGTRISQPRGVTMLSSVWSTITSGTCDCANTRLLSGSMPAASQSSTISCTLGRISLVSSPCMSVRAWTSTAQ